MNKDSNCLISVITPSYNSKDFIVSTINSVLSQSYKNWELLITDDCSSDNTWDIIKEYSLKDDRIKVFKLAKNSGAPTARNNSLSNAKGKFIAFLDSDDLWLPNKLERQIDFMKSNDYAFSFSSYECINESGENLNHIIEAPQLMTYSKYLKNTIIGCLTVVIDKSKVGYFEMPNIKSSHDMALWLSILKKGFDAHGMNEVLSQYRIVSTSNTANKFKAAKDVWRVYRNIEGLSILRSLWCFSFYVINAIYKRL